jgi:hypothetical protein
MLTENEQRPTAEPSRDLVRGLEELVLLDVVSMPLGVGIVVNRKAQEHGDPPSGTVAHRRFSRAPGPTARVLACKGIRKIETR